jgi:hypothetical protein
VNISGTFLYSFAGSSLHLVHIFWLLDAFALISLGHRFSSLHLSFPFSLFHARYMNHAFLNGIAAGVWYLYFTLTLLNTNKQLNYIRNHIGLAWGLVISTFSVVTCGFPEASVTIAEATCKAAHPTELKNRHCEHHVAGNTSHQPPSMNRK